MKFTKTLIVIAIVLGLLSACFVGCFADEVCYTTISQGGEQFVNKATLPNDDAVCFAESPGGIVFYMWYLNSVNGYENGSTTQYVCMASTMGNIEEDTGWEYRFFVFDKSQLEFDTTPTYYQLIQLYSNEYSLVMETTKTDGRLTVAQNAVDFIEQYNISFIEDVNGQNTEYVVTSTINYCLNSTKGGNEDMTVVEQVLGVFSAVGDWFAGIIPSMLSVFYSTETNTLTVIGVLAVCSLAIAVILLVLAWIVDFFKFRR